MQRVHGWSSNTGSKNYNFLNPRSTVSSKTWNMGAEAKLYLHQHSIPQLFEGLMTGLIYNRPKEPLIFLETAIAQIRTNPKEELTWDMFIDRGKVDILSELEVSPKISSGGNEERSNSVIRTHPNDVRKSVINTAERSKKFKHKEKEKEENQVSLRNIEDTQVPTPEMGRAQRSPSVMKAAEVAHIPHVPIILFIGGPGGGKTRHAARVASALADQGLIHICMPDMIRSALAKYKDQYSEWKTAHEHYLRGELIPNHLALALVKAEMGRHSEASAFFLEGFPREARQVEDFEKEVKSVNMALILDYDEKTLREHMEKRGMGMEIIDQRIKEFKQKTLPSAKYFDDHRLLHLIPGEKDDQTIFERMKELVRKAMCTGVPVFVSNSSKDHDQREVEQNNPDSTRIRSPKTQSMIPAQVSHDDFPSVCGGADVARDAVQELQKTKVDGVVSENISSDSPKNDSSVSKPSHIPLENETIALEAPFAPYNNEVVISQIPSSSRADSRVVRKSPPPPKTATRTYTTPLANEPLLTGIPTDAPVLLVIGAPGAQKANIARCLAQKYEGFLFLSMGVLLRAKVSAESRDELWQRVERKMDEGEPVPMKLCRELLYHQLHRYGKTSWGFVIEGYPRTEAQLVDIQSVLKRIDIAILIDCTEQFCIDTLSRRFRDGSEVRPDDSPNVVKRRLALFKQNTLPMLKLLDESGLLRVIEGDSNVDTVFKDVSTAVDRALLIREHEGGRLQKSKRYVAANE